MDKAVEMALESVGVPSVILRTDEEMQQRREEAKQAQQEQALSEQMVNLSTPDKSLVALAAFTICSDNACSC
jgi:hypothetical protein